MVRRSADWALTRQKTIAEFAGRGDHHDAARHGHRLRRLRRARAEALIRPSVRRRAGSPLLPAAREAAVRALNETSRIDRRNASWAPTGRGRRWSAIATSPSALRRPRPEAPGCCARCAPTARRTSASEVIWHDAVVSVRGLRPDGGVLDLPPPAARAAAARAASTALQFRRPRRCGSLIGIASGPSRWFRRAAAHGVLCEPHPGSSGVSSTRHGTRVMPSGARARSCATASEGFSAVRSPVSARRAGPARSDHEVGASARPRRRASPRADRQSSCRVSSTTRSRRASRARAR